MSKLLSLMYHSIYMTDDEYRDISIEDRPYALSCHEFERHLQWLVGSDFNVIDPNNKLLDLSDRMLNVLITFDDGHIGFYMYAYPLLLKYGFSAIFFITTDFIGDRKEFCSWDQLNEMSLNNMLIQSHGKTHKFISDLDDNETRNEFKVSKELIERNTGSSVWSISFPGGRYTSNSIQIGCEENYTHFFTSDENIQNLSVNLNSKIGRFAIKNSTTVTDIKNFIDPPLSIFIKHKAISFIKVVLKRTLGNNGYHKLYKALNKSG